MDIEDVQRALLAAGFEKLTISAPVYTMRDEPTRQTERGMWQVSVKPNSTRLDWQRGRWKPTLAEAMISCLGDLLKAEQPAPQAERPATSTTDLTGVL